MVRSGMPQWLHNTPGIRHRVITFNNPSGLVLVCAAGNVDFVIHDGGSTVQMSMFHVLKVLESSFFWVQCDDL